LGTLLVFFLLGVYGIIIPSLALDQVLVAIVLSAVFTFGVDFPKYYVFRKFKLSQVGTSWRTQTLSYRHPARWRTASTKGHECELRDKEKPTTAFALSSVGGASGCSGDGGSS
jgi:Zn-dependent protease with chaperone function